MDQAAVQESEAQKAPVLSVRYRPVAGKGAEDGQRGSGRLHDTAYSEAVGREGQEVGQDDQAQEYLSHDGAFGGDEGVEKPGQAVAEHGGQSCLARAADARFSVVDRGAIRTDLVRVLQPAQPGRPLAVDEVLGLLLALVQAPPEPGRIHAQLVEELYVPGIIRHSS